MSWFLSVKVILMSLGVISMVVALKISVPLMMEFSFSYLPLIWASIILFLNPPYIYIIINGIIISIVASTRFQQKESEGFVEMEIPSSSSSSYGKVEEEIVDVGFDEVKEIETERVDLMGDEVFVVEEVKDVEEISGSVLQAEEEDGEEGEDKFVISASPTWMSDTMRLSEKPRLSSRFGHRKPARATLEGGKALGVISKPKRHDTLENTWKAITEGRAMPLSRHMKKCETWENHGRQIIIDPSPVKKLETFKDRTNQALMPSDLSPALPMKLRKEPSLSQDELNRRVENFINKFNEEMRLQREQSLKNYWEMVKTGDK